MKKRIIISVTNDLSNDQRLNRVATTLQARGFEVLLVGRRRKSSVKLQEKTYQVHRMNLLFETGKLFYLEYAVRLFLFLLFRKCDVLLANDMDTLLPNYLVAKLRRKRLCYDSHEYWTEVPELIDRPATRRVWLWLEKRLFPRVDAAATVNRSIADIYEQKYGLPVHVFRNVPYRKQVRQERAGPGKILIYQGALNVKRGIELMIEAMGHLPNYKLWIYGYGPVEEELKALASQKGLMGRVDFKGFVNFEQLDEITHQASLGMSIEEDQGASYHFALPNKLFDYIQAGLPVLVSNLPEMVNIAETYKVGEVLNEEERTGELLADKIKAMLEDQSKWLSFHRACRHSAEDLCWENEKEALFKFIEG